MTRRQAVLDALRFRDPGYVPWHFGFTEPALAKLAGHYGEGDVMARMGNHFHALRSPVGGFEPVGEERYRDPYGVVWDRAIDRDIGTVCDSPIKEPTLDGYEFPSWDRNQATASMTKALECAGDRLRQFAIGFSLFERAWTLRGMEDLLVDFIERPLFAHELLDAICEHNLAIVDWALGFDLDMVHFGDDWGQQRGLLMGPRLWREFIKPRLSRMYGRVKQGRKLVSIHSCGDVKELFPELIDLGLDLFNPFQPEVMDVYEQKRTYYGRLAFHGGMSTQRTLPFATPAQVRAETRRLLDELGRGGGYIFAPAHAVPGDVPIENLLAFIEVVHAQPGAPRG